STRRPPRSWSIAPWSWSSSPSPRGGTPGAPTPAPPATAGDRGRPGPSRRRPADRARDPPRRAGVEPPSPCAGSPTSNDRDSSARRAFGSTGGCPRGGRRPGGSGAAVEVRYYEAGAEYSYLQDGRNDSW